MVPDRAPGTARQPPRRSRDPSGATAPHTVQRVSDEGAVSPPPFAISPCGKTTSITTSTATMSLPTSFVLKAVPVRRSTSASSRATPPLSLSLPGTPDLPAINDDAPQSAQPTVGECCGNEAVKCGMCGAKSPPSLTARGSVATTENSIVADGAAALSELELDEDRVTSDILADLMVHQGDNLLLLDLRSFIAYNKSHISGAIHISPPHVLVRRATCVLDTVEKSLRGGERDRWMTRNGLTVVLYDETSTMTKQNKLLVRLFHSLKQERIVKTVSWLEGGLMAFQAEHREHCKVCCGPAKQLFGRIDLGRACSAPKTANSQTASGPNEPVQILNFLYLGGEKVASNADMLRHYGIKYILNTAQECCDTFPDDFVYCRLDLRDLPNQGDLLPIFERGFAFINRLCPDPLVSVSLRRWPADSPDAARDSNQRVLVHCRAGQSRSVTVVLAYLMRTLQWTRQKAYDYVQRRRPAMSPNLGFMGQLCNYEDVLRNAGPVSSCIKGGVSLPAIAYTPRAEEALRRVPAAAPVAMARGPAGGKASAKASSWSYSGSSSLSSSLPSDRAVTVD